MLPASQYHTRPPSAHDLTKVHGGGTGLVLGAPSLDEDSVDGDGDAGDSGSLSMEQLLDPQELRNQVHHRAWVHRGCVLRAACCVLHAACCVLRAACCMLHAACCVLRAACCVLRAACGVLRAACWEHGSCVLRAACFVVVGIASYSVFRAAVGRCACTCLGKLGMFACSGG